MPNRTLWAQIDSVEILAFLSAIFGVAMGRFVYWIDRRQRPPTLRELLYEPFMICAMGIATAGVLQIFGITSPLAVGGVSAISGVYGPRVFDIMVGATASRLGLREDICKIQPRDDTKNDPS